MRTAQRHTREELIAAVSASRSWRGVLRELGRPESSAGALRSVRRCVDQLGIDHTHFTGQRRWSDHELTQAVNDGASWGEVLDRLGLVDSGSNLIAVKGHAVRLGLDLRHLSTDRARPSSPFDQPPKADNLRKSGANLAAAWFQLRGYDVLWPLEPCRYDFVVRSADSFERIQVKTTCASDRSQAVSISATRHERRGAYDIDEVDHFFIVDAALNAYLIPFAAVAGYGRICLSAYACYLVTNEGDWSSTPVVSEPGARAPVPRSRSGCR